MMQVARFVPSLTVALALGGHLSYADMGPKDVRSQVKLYSENQIIGTLSNLKQLRRRRQCKHH